MLNKLNDFNAKEVNKIPLPINSGGKYDVIFTFNARDEAKAYYEFFKDPKNYSGYIFPNL